MGKRILLNSRVANLQDQSKQRQEKQNRMGRPPLSPDQKLKREMLLEEARIKRELRIAAKIERERTKRPVGRPKKDLVNWEQPIRKKRSHNFFDEDLPKMPIQRPPAIYDNQSYREKYGL